MSTIGETIKGIQKILTLQVRMDQLETSNRKVAEDNKVMAEGLQTLDRRVARIEGFIEGATATPRRGRLTKANA